MRIAIISSSVHTCPPIGYGSEATAWYLAEELCKRKHEVLLFAPPGSKTPSNGNLLPIPFVNGLDSSEVERAERVPVTRYSSLLKTCDIVHDMSLNAATAEKLCVEYHDSIPHVATLNGISFWHPVAPADHNVVVVSEAARRCGMSGTGAWLNTPPAMQAQFNGYPGKLSEEPFVVRYGLDETFYRPTESRSDYILYVGRPHPGKGIEIVLDLAARMTGEKFVLAWRPDTEDHGRFDKQYREAAKRLPNVEVVELPDGAQHHAVKRDLQAGAAVAIHPPVYVDACFPAEQIVMTTNGVRPISDIAVGDKIIDASGNPTTVTRTNRRHFSGDLLDISVVGLPKIKVTPEHPFLVARCEHIDKQRQRNSWRRYGNRIGTVKLAEEPLRAVQTWMEAKDIRVGDYVAVPKTKRAVCAPPPMQLSKGAGGYARRGKICDIAWSIEITSDLMWFFGLYLAEGSFSGGHQVQIDLNAKTEQHIAKRVVAIMNTLGFPTQLRIVGACVRVSIGSTALVRWIEENFSHRATQKRIPTWVRHCPDRLIDRLIDGYLLGDGHYAERGQVIVETVSPNLAYGMHDLMRLRGIFARLHIANEASKGVILGRSVNLNRSYVLSFASSGRSHALDLGDQFLIRVSEIKHCSFDGDVFNLTTATDTYSLPVAVHNCPSTPIEALLCGTPVVCTAHGGNPEIVLNRQDGFCLPIPPAYWEPRTYRAWLDSWAEYIEVAKTYDRKAIRDRAVERHSAGRMADDYLRVYDAVIRRMKPWQLM